MKKILSLFIICIVVASQDHNFEYGGSIEKYGNGYKIGASEAFIQNKGQKERKKKQEVRFISSSIIDTIIKGKAGIDYKKNKYGSFSFDYLNDKQNESLEIKIDQDFFNTFTNQSVNVTYLTADVGSKNLISIGIKQNNFGKKDIIGLLESKNQLSEQTEGDIILFARNNELSANAKLKQNISGLIVEFKGNSLIIIPSQSLYDYDYGFLLSKELGKGNLVGVETKFYKNNVKTGLAFGNYNEGNINATGSIKYDLNTQQSLNQEALLEIKNNISDSIHVKGKLTT